MKRGLSIAAISAVTLAASACGAAAPGPNRTASAGAQAITVYAAASLVNVLKPLDEQFRTAHPGADILLSTGGSSALVQQVIAGAPADVMLTADTRTMQALADAKLVKNTSIFAENSLVVVTPTGAQTQVRSLTDLRAPKAPLVIAQCQAAVPCGAATEALKKAAGLDFSGATLSEEPDVTHVLQQVLSAQADVGFVYATDAKSAGASVTTVELPAGIVANNRYPAAVVDQPGRSASQQALAEDYVAFLSQHEAKTVLQQAGFIVPSSS